MESSGLRKKCTYCTRHLPIEVFTFKAGTTTRITKCPACNAKHLRACHESKIRKRALHRNALQRGDAVATWLCARCGEKPVTQFDYNHRLGRFMTNCRACMPVVAERSKRYKQASKTLLFMAELAAFLQDPLVPDEDDTRDRASADRTSCSA